MLGQIDNELDEGQINDLSQIYIIIGTAGN